MGACSGTRGVFPLPKHLTRTDSRTSFGAHAILTNKVVLTREILDKLPDLEYVGVTATGINVIDLDYAEERRVAVTNVPGYSTTNVAQMVFAHLLHLASHVANYNNAVRVGKWTASEHFCFSQEPVWELAGKTLGIVGYGAIGQKVAEIGRAFDMRVIVAELPGREYFDPRTPFVRALFLSDILSLHCPLTQQLRVSLTLMPFQR